MQRGWVEVVPGLDTDAIYQYTSLYRPSADGLKVEGRT